MPCKKSAFQTYTKQYYQSRIKPEYQRRWATLTREYDEATEAERVEKGLQEPVSVSVRTLLNHEFWKSESEEFRQGIENEVAQEHLQALEEWQKRKKEPVTPQQFHQ